MSGLRQLKNMTGADWRNRRKPMLRQSVANLIIPPFRGVISVATGATVENSGFGREYQVSQIIFSGSKNEF